MNIEEYRELWQPGFSGVVLIRLDPGTIPEEFVIYNTNTTNVLLIEDEESHDEVVHRMIEAGAPIWDDFPPRVT
ncbi:hypothetical protein ABT300_06640 [Streptomyces sp. NPDC001027]|uniref:hypothetical protein n=1 Tax=Streptomyces sp. NPDC001027 TaxID=3154771 RepID=UPI00332F006F